MKGSKIFTTRKEITRIVVNAARNANMDERPKIRNKYINKSNEMFLVRSIFIRETYLCLLRL
jgi:hypothetical protein